MAAPVIWIEKGCIECGWCQNLEPRVFIVSAGGCEIRADARSDGCSSPNREERTSLHGNLLDEAAAGFIGFIADGCPVQVIHMTADISDGIVT